MSIIYSTLEYNSWETIQKIVKANAIIDVGWEIGDTKTLTINGTTKTATLIGINHDGINTATFMVMDSIGTYQMNTASEGYPFGNNIGGWKDSEMREWLNTDIYNSMTDVKNYIKEVYKYTNNKGYQGTVENITITKDKVFLLSVKEANLQNQLSDYTYIKTINAEGTPYEWFLNNTIPDSFWLRSPISSSFNSFVSYDHVNINNNYSYLNLSVHPAFVIG